MERYLYHAELEDFLSSTVSDISRTIVANDRTGALMEQRQSWDEQIEILQEQLAPWRSGDIFFEYTIPRVGKRVDVVVIINGIIFLIEFKVGSDTYDATSRTQAIDYALNLNDFHAASHGATMIPILVATEAPNYSLPNELSNLRDNISELLLCNKDSIQDAIRLVLNQRRMKKLDALEWARAPYQPTPTIIEAAQALYNSHDVEAISRSDAHAKNLNETTQQILEIIKQTKENNEKAICFITGVPGSGKTLAGLNLATQLHDFEEDLHAVFLSGNGPLVDVLQEALVQDQVAQHKAERAQDSSIEVINKKDFEREVKSFIQNIYNFRDDALVDVTQPPNERIAIFDEAQRAWDQKKLSSFMKTKRNQPHFQQSEPEFLIGCMDRHGDWAVIICLVGGGQSIHDGEAGIIEWFKATRDHFTNWKVYASPNITGEEYTDGTRVKDLLEPGQLTEVPLLHLSVSLRSFRAENVSNFVGHVLDGNFQEAKVNFAYLNEPKENSYEAKYPIVITRDIDAAREWVKSKAQGSERYGIVASSTAKRLRPEGIWVDADFKPAKWFLDKPQSILSSNMLEITGTEFDVQGLELDWTVVCIDADIRTTIDPETLNASFEYKNFRGNQWTNENETNQQFTKNAYRVLLTRARMGMAIFIPEGDPDDPTRLPEFYDGFYRFLKSLDIPEIEKEEV